MRVISLLAVSILAASASATSTVDHSSIANSNAEIEFSRRIFAAQQQPNRVLRRYDDEKEDRGIEKLDDVVERADDVLAKVTHTSPKVKNSAWATVRTDTLNAFKSKLNVLKRYPEVLEPSAVAQLVKVEEQRMKDVALLKQMNKKKPDGLQRPIESFPGMKTAPVKESHVGRDQQRYAEDGSRLLSCVVVSRPPKQGGGDVLLISSSNPNKQEWLLPKGGWDEGESIHKAAWREAIEEGGVHFSLRSRFVNQF
ncbi:unnamed protein product [Phytophthora lilii]|uniref:RxLR effector protein n=1 Tax=Phytophthora lilii TaxID=2077276 RepID=A0A9W6WUF2_9STRA|nr:unnamed protein product [Phytophthora lilii]